MTEKQQHPHNCATCGHHRIIGVVPDIEDCDICDHIPTQFEKAFVLKMGCASHTNAITLTPTLTQHYTERSQATGKPVQALVLQDLAALHKKRVAREDRRVFKEIEYERL